MEKFPPRIPVMIFAVYGRCRLLLEIGTVAVMIEQMWKRVSLTLFIFFFLLLENNLHVSFVIIILFFLFWVQHRKNVYIFPGELSLIYVSVRLFHIFTNFILALFKAVFAILFAVSQCDLWNLTVKNVIKNRSLFLKINKCLQCYQSLGRLIYDWGKKLRSEMLLSQTAHLAV